MVPRFFAFQNNSTKIFPKTNRVLKMFPALSGQLDVLDINRDFFLNRLISKIEIVSFGLNSVSVCQLVYLGKLSFQGLI